MRPTSEQSHWTAFAAELRARGLGDGTDLAQEYRGEVWQFMNFLPDPDGTMWAEFRHRRHPSTKHRMYLRVEVPLLPGEGEWVHV